MIQGTASHVGKSIITAGLCRIFAEEGYKVAPFKSQNMSLNSFVTESGAEIARAQELQARAAGIKPSSFMNPVLLKPKDEGKCEVILLGKSIGDFSAQDYFQKIYGKALCVIRESLQKLSEEFELVIIEGAGSPAEVNLRRWDLCNMKVAQIADAPVLLVADIDRGGALASLVGTLALLTWKERERIKGFIINKFRGDFELLKSALTFLQERTGKKVVGVLPYFESLYLDEEDTLRDFSSFEGEVAVIRLPYLSNFTDFDPLQQVTSLKWVGKPEELDGVKIIIIPGTRNTIKDLRWIGERGFAEKIREKAGEGVAILGICGGYQMLGEKIFDLEGIESDMKKIEGLSLLPVVTYFRRRKITSQVRAEVVKDIPLFPGLRGKELYGYEIHAGRVEIKAQTAPLLFKRGENLVPDGAVSKKGTIFGTHLHGLFHNPEVISALMRYLGENPCDYNYQELVEESLSKLAQSMRENLDIEYIYSLLGVK
jgi:adenosylcobyric acid synthase